MLQIDLLQLTRSRRLALDAEIGPDADVWAGSGLSFSGAVEVSASASLTPDGGLTVLGSWRAPVLYDCGRCLEELRVSVERPLTLFYSSGEEEDGGDPDARTLGRRQTVVDLAEALREEVLLEVPRYMLPDQEDGRCLSCGQPVERFRHAPEEAGGNGADPRWAALEALQVQAPQTD